jgi:hypothetical protein
MIRRCTARMPFDTYWDRSGPLRIRNRSTGSSLEWPDALAEACRFGLKSLQLPKVDP